MCKFCYETVQNNKTHKSRNKNWAVEVLLNPRRFHSINLIPCVLTACSLTHMLKINFNPLVSLATWSARDALFSPALHAIVGWKNAHLSRNYLLALQYDMPAESSPADLVSVSRITFPSLVRNNFKRVIKRQSRPSPARLASRIELTEMLKANF
jgi:hypothetical protein